MLRALLLAVPLAFATAAHAVTETSASTAVSGASAAATGLGIAASPSGSADDTMVLEAGHYKCELKNSVIVRQIDADRGALVLSWRGKDHTMRAVESKSGALRYESAETGLAWITIVGKSFLLDTKKGQRVAAECRL
ncbi:MAG TPA: MliC family protein [Burkholderiaceae bacterium]|nr:MliC family protein [Burkholderiaceae bacterium]